MQLETRSPTVLLPGTLRLYLQSAAMYAYPREACGLLIGRRMARQTEVFWAEEARNRNLLHTDRFELDPADFVRADGHARADHLDVVGVWHTHPDHRARPSPFDLERAWENWSYVILSVSAAGVVELRSWRLMGADFWEEAIEP